MLSRRLAVFAIVAAPLLLTSCAHLMGPRQMEIPVARLQEALSRQFPFNNRYLELLDVRVTNPRVALLPDSNRILTSMDASIAPPFMNKSWLGNLAVSGQLRFDPARNALVLAEPRVETFDVMGLDPLYANQIRRVGSLLAEQLLKDVPLYTFRPDEFRYAGTTFLPTQITTRSSGLVVTFEPVR
ncbi:MAG TPA: DUF1439 domain-containing protein [Noviherbaspirillum sp.]|nr:DUF1439 domain-containing protein [Noviherbaspirillum sp.]